MRGLVFLRDQISVKHPVELDSPHSMNLSYIRLSKIGSFPGLKECLAHLINLLCGKLSFVSLCYLQVEKYPYNNEIFQGQNRGRHEISKKQIIPMKQCFGMNQFHLCDHVEMVKLQCLLYLISLQTSRDCSNACNCINA